MSHVATCRKFPVTFPICHFWGHRAATTNYPTCCDMRHEMGNGKSQIFNWRGFWGNSRPGWSVIVYALREAKQWPVPPFAQPAGVPVSVGETRRRPDKPPVQYDRPCRSRDTWPVSGSPIRRVPSGRIGQPEFLMEAAMVSNSGPRNQGQRFLKPRVLTDDPLCL